MDQIEQMPSLKSTDVKSFERFADLVRIAVVKLQAEGRDGELGEGTFHSLLVKNWRTDRLKVTVVGCKNIKGTGQ